MLEIIHLILTAVDKDTTLDKIAVPADQKTPSGMYNFIYKTWFYLQNCDVMGMGEKPRKKNEHKSE